MSPELSALIEEARGHVMTPDERRAQTVSFAHGNIVIEDPAMPRALVERQLAKLEESGEISFE
jgi:hypothetical protein